MVCALYAKEHGLLDTFGSKQFKKIANRHKKLICLVNQAKLQSYQSAPKYMFGYHIPRDYKEAIKLDKGNGKTKWQDCTCLENMFLPGLLLSKLLSCALLYATGVPICDHNFLFGDNNFVLGSSTTPDANCPRDMSCYPSTRSVR